MNVTQALRERHRRGAHVHPIAPELHTAESVTEGHPDKVADTIADTILDAHLAQDPFSRVAVEVLVKQDTVVLAGEISSAASPDLESIVRGAIRDIGYEDPTDPFHADGVRITHLLTRQAEEIAAGTRPAANQGAGDQGFMIGYASDETPSLMPLPVVLAHAITRQLAADRKDGTAPWLRPDGKSQVTVRYHGRQPIEVTRVVVSTQHAGDQSQSAIQAYVRDRLLPLALGQWWCPGLSVDINPSGSFVQGGPSADAGVTGRKTAVDSYGGAARHGGGAFSGKDPSKVDRSAAYFARWAARRVVRLGIAHRVEVEVAYAIGVAQPVALSVGTFGTGDLAAATALVEALDFRPAAIIEQLELLRPIYRDTTNYGHVGRRGLPWEA